MEDKISQGEASAEIENWFETLCHLLSARASLMSVWNENFAELSLEEVRHDLEFKISDCIKKINSLTTVWL